MRFLIYSIFVLLLITSCNKSKEKGEISSDLINNPATASSKTKNSKKMPEITFEKTTHDFGEIVQGEIVSYAFKFTNTGKRELIISNIVPSCGCTVPKFPKRPIKPNESDFIVIIFDSKGRKNNFFKNVSIFANTIPDMKKLYIKGFIITK